MRHHAVAVVISVGMVLSGLTAGPCSGGSRSPEGFWQPLPGFEKGPFEQVHDLCWYQGRLHVVGVVTTELAQRSAPAGVFVRQDDAWHLVRELGAHQEWRIAADASNLAVIGYRAVHHLRDGYWEKTRRTFNGKVSAAAYWQGDLFLAGNFYLDDHAERRRLLRWDGWNARPVDGRIGGVPAPAVHALLATDDGLWVAGRFAQVGDHVAHNIARWDQDGWHDLDGGTDGEVVAIAQGVKGVAITGIFGRAGGVASDGLAIWSHGSWQQLPGLPPDWRAALGGPTCPLPRVRHLGWLGDRLFAAGPFAFVDAANDTARGQAILVDGTWCRLPGAERLGGPWPVRALAGDGDGDSLALLAEKRFLAVVVDEPEVLPPGPATDHDATRLARWGGNLLALGPEFVADRRFAGLAQLTPDGWRPVGDWFGASGSSGGRVDAAVDWRGDLVVAGHFDQVADQVVRHIAAFDGRSWRPLGQGIPSGRLSSPLLLPRTEDLVLIGQKRNRFGHADGPPDVWRWDGEAWQSLPLPHGRVVTGRDGWLAAIDGDTIRVVTRRWRNSDPFPGFDAQAVLGLYELIGSTWNLVSAWSSGTMSSASFRHGVLHMVDLDVQRMAGRVVRWTGQQWQDVIDQEISHTGFSHPLKFLPDGRMLLAGTERSLVWDGQFWASWPGSGPRSDGKLLWLDGRLYRHPGMGHAWEVWQGPLPAADPRVQPLDPIAQPRRPESKIDLASLAPLLPAPADTAFRWRVWHDNSGERRTSVTAWGAQGIDIEGKSVSIKHDFEAPGPTWYRLTGSVKIPVRDASGSIDLHPRETGYSRSAFFRPGRTEFALILPQGKDGHGGFVKLQFDGQAEIRDLTLEARPELLVRMLDEMWTQLIRCWRRPPGGAAALPPELPADIVDRASRAFTVTESDSLLLAMATLTEDPRLWIDGHCRGCDEISSIAKASSWRTRTAAAHAARRYPAPVGSQPCEVLPSGVNAWLPGDLAYAALPSHHGEGFLPRLDFLEAAGLILDLREPEREPKNHGFRVRQALSALRTGDRRWARVRDSGDKTLGWWGASKVHSATRVPLIVLISSDTDGAHALLAEALSRLDHVTVIGEPTAPLPAPYEEILVPWADWSLLVPAGGWEGPGRRVLTDTRLEPDVVWPAGDTEGLVGLAREVVDAWDAL